MYERCEAKCDGKQCILDAGHLGCHQIYIKGIVVTYSRCDDKKENN